MKLNCSYEKSTCMSFFDIYSLSANVKIKGKDSYSYVLSIILSLFSIIIIAIISIYFIVTTFKRKSVSIVFNMDSMVYPVINMTEFPMTAQLYDTFGNTLPEQDRIFYITARYWKFKTEFDENNQPYIKNEILDIPLEKCEIDKHFGNYREYFAKTADLSTKYCLPANSYNLTIYGKYGDLFGGFSVLQFFVRKCLEGADSKKNCNELDMIDNILTTVHLEFSHIDYDIDHNNPIDPRVITRKAEVYQMSSTIYRKIIKSISPVEYTSDYGYIFEKKENLKFFQDNTDTMEMDLRKEGIVRGSFSSLILHNSPKTHKYNRDYIKLQYLFATIGGIINGITITFKILHFIFSSNLLNFILFKSLFEILEDPNKKYLKEELNEILQKEKKNILSQFHDDNSKYIYNTNSNIIINRRINYSQKDLT